MSDLLQRARAVKLAIFDVDGVLTDGRLYFLEDGSEFKTFNTLDGHGIKMLIASGVRTAIISGRKTPVVERRANNLGIQHLFQGREDKLVVLDGLLAELADPAVPFRRTEDAKTCQWCDFKNICGR